MDREKYVDESWKESAEAEKEKLKHINPSAAAGKAQVHKEQAPAPQASPDQVSEPESEPAVEEPAEEQPSQEQEEQANPINFLNYVSSLAYQAMIFIGEIPNPNTNLVTKNLEQAKFIIDTLALLRVKTKGNLNKQESDFLNGSLYELQMKFIEVYQKETQVWSINPC